MQKCKNILSKTILLKLFIVFKMKYFCCFSLGGNLEFLNFLPKSFITLIPGLEITEWTYNRDVMSLSPGMGF